MTVMHLKQLDVKPEIMLDLTKSSFSMKIISINLYNKTNIRIYVPYSQPNGWTDWAEIFCGWPGGVIGLQKIQEIFFPRATPGPSASI